jgi:hypothetical protein
MNEKEKIEFYIAMCNCCVMAEAMKDCPLCRFNIGLAKEVKLVDSIPLSESAQVAIFAISEQC